MIISYKVKFGLVCVSLVISLSLLEFALRFYRVGDDERNLLYEHHKLLGWFPQKNVSREFTGANTIQINHNSNGFRDKEITFDNAKKRILILGDSFAYGYDSEVHERFSEILDNNLENYQIFNLGVSGYSTDQELLLLKEYYHLIEPDLVYLLYHHNDWHGNSVNHIYNGYYKPYFSVDNNKGTLQLNGVPVPKSIKHLKYDFPFIYDSKIAIWLTQILYSSKIRDVKLKPNITFDILLELRKFVEENLNAKFKIGIVGNGNTPGLTEFFNTNEFDAVVIDQNKSKEFFTSTGHWSKLGNQRASEKILRHLSFE